jgi:hypothetical protein
MGPTGPLGIAIATVATQETYATNAWGNLPGGPAVTATVPESGSVMVVLTCAIEFNSSAAGSTEQAFMSFSSSGGSGDVSPSFARSRAVGTRATFIYESSSATFVVTGLSAGGHTFTAKYCISSGAGTTKFSNRSITVIPVQV